MSVQTVKCVTAFLRHSTSVTGNVRRVAEFDPELVCKAIQINKPTTLVLNHVDYIDWSIHQNNENIGTSFQTKCFVENIEKSIDRKIDLIGFGPDNEDLVEW